MKDRSGSDDGAASTDGNRDTCIERNPHVKITLTQGQGSSKMSMTEDFRVLGIFTNAHNKNSICMRKKNNVGVKG